MDKYSQDEVNHGIHQRATLREVMEMFQKNHCCKLLVRDDAQEQLGYITIYQLISLLKEQSNLDQSLYQHMQAGEIEILPMCEMQKMSEMQKILGIHQIEEFLLTKAKKCSVNDLLYRMLAMVWNQLQMIVERAPAGIMAIDEKGTIIVYNSEAERMIKVKKQDALGNHISVVDESEGLLEVVRSGQGETAKKYEVNGLRFMTNRSSLINNEGDVIGAVSIFQEISEIEKISEELDSTKHLLEEINDILEASYDGIFITDHLGRITKVNSSWEKMCDLSREAVIGKTPKEMIEAGIYSKSAAQTALETGKASTVMLEMTAGANNGKIILATGKPIFNKSGEIKAVVTNVRDITELENLKVQLQHSKTLTEKYSKEIHEIRRQHQTFSDMVVKSAEMKKVMDLASRVAEVDTTVLVTGESGVGKEIIVGYIHKQSSRSKGPMIKINCGAIPGNLLESELFGYDSGAFTGARKTGKMGLFELAHEGTIFLDEIGEIPLDLQVKLLRVIQNKEITRVGGTKPTKVDVRIVAATNRDLKKMTEEGRFREDLYYRLNVINIHIPALRDRKEDIPALIAYMLQKFNDQHHRVIRISSQVLNILTDYCWPGNIRQLENLMEQLVILIDGNEILPCHLPEIYCKQSPMDKKIYVQGIIPLKEAVEIVEEQIIMNAKNKYCSTRKIAEVLGVNQSTIVRKLKDMALKKDA